MIAGRPGPIVNAMTVDVEDYFHASAFGSVVPRARWDSLESRVVANTRQLLDLFAQAQVNATFFVLGWVASRHPGLVRDIVGAGHEIASHGYHHELLYLQTPQQFREDVRASKLTLENITGRRVLGFRAPSFSVTNASLWALDVLFDEGYQYDASVFPIYHDRYGIPNAPRHAHERRTRAGGLLEIPPSTVRVCRLNLPIGGGGYFRLLPYAWTRWGVRRVNRAEVKPVVFYIHPWEIDPDQPRLAVGRVLRLRHYGGLRRTKGRLQRLLAEFRFDAVATLMNLQPEVCHAGVR